jgi:hypothetical protein
VVTENMVKFNSAFESVISNVRFIGRLFWMVKFGERQTVMCDIHGVIYDVQKKYEWADIKFLRGSEEWYAFLRDYPTYLEDDRPIGNGREIIAKIKERYTFAGLTGVVEDKVRREKIHKWFDFHKYPQFDILFMRPKTLREEHENLVELDAKFKAEVVKMIHESIVPVRLVIDDRKGILDEIKNRVSGVETFLFSNPCEWDRLIQILKL